MTFKEATLAMAKVHLSKTMSRPLDLAKVKRFEDDLKIRGMLSPIIVIDLGAEGCEVLTGQHRFQAACNLKWPTIPVRILDKVPSESERLGIIYAENQMRSDFTPGERLAIIHRLKLLNPAATLDDLRKQLNTSASDISKYLSIAEKLSVTLRSRWEAGTLPTSIAYELSRAISHAEQERLASLYDKGLLTREQLIREVSKRHGSTKVRKLVLKQGGMSITLTGAREWTLDAVQELTQQVEKALASCRKQNLDTTVLPALFAGLR